MAAFLFVNYSIGSAACGANVFSVCTLGPLRQGVLPDVRPDPRGDVTRSSEPDWRYLETEPGSTLRDLTIYYAQTL